MITNCPVCGKAFDVLWADLWRYRRDGRYICSYGCLRQIDGEDIEMNKFTKEQKQEAIRIALDGGDPKAYLMSIGSSAPDKLWSYMKTQLLKKDPETYEKLARSRKRADDPPESEFTPVTVNVDGELRIEANDPANVEVVKIPTATWPTDGPNPGDRINVTYTTMEYKTTGISTPIGDWQYVKRAGYLDWTTLTGETVSMSLEEWKELMKLFPEVLKVLEVKL